jgi:hypothetical protein
MRRRETGNRSQEGKANRYRTKTDLPFLHSVWGWFLNEDQMPRKDAFWAGRKPALAREPNPAYTEGVIRGGIRDTVPSGTRSPYTVVGRRCIPGRTRAIIGNWATTAPGSYGPLVIVANGSYELPEPGISYKPDFRHEKRDLRPQNTFHWAISY